MALLAVAIVAILVTGVLVFANSSYADKSPLSLSFLKLNFNSSAKDTAQKAVDYLNTNVLQDGQTATVGDVSEESGIIKMQVKIGENSYDSYVTKDGKLFFPEAIKMGPAEGTGGDAPAATGPATFEITEDDHVRGDASAKVTLVEFSDFECPFCEKFTPTVEQIMKEYAGKVRLVYKHFPLSNIHPNAQKAAEASECASEQGKFWEYYNVLFKNQPGGFSIDKFKAWAGELKLNTTQFNACLDSSKYATKVKVDAAEGTAKGVTGTPATFINGALVSGNQPYDSFKAKIDAILNAN